MRRPCALLTVVLALAAPASAAASGDDVLRDCNDDEQLSKRYTQKEYREALDNIPADIRQYTNCQAVIRQAQLAAAGSSGGSAGGGSSGGAGGGGTGGANGAGGTGTGPTTDETLAAATPEQKRGLAEATQQDPGAVTLPGGGAALDPAGAGETPDFGSFGELPGSLGALVVLMLGAGAALGINRLRNRVSGRRTA